MLSFGVVGAADAAGRVCRAAGLVTDATSLGGVRTFKERRTGWPGEAAMGGPLLLVGVSVGIGQVEDLWADLEQALEQA